MDAVMALCHFCEQHGPSIVFTCEKVKKAHYPSENIVNEQDSEVFTEPCSSAMDIGYATPYGSLDSLASNVTISSNRSSIKKADLCQACRSLPEGHQHFVSHDKDAGVIYRSMQHPNNPDVFRLVRHACVRSLSSEVCPGREGPIMFGDEQHGYVISFTFYVKDNYARGGQRWYSIICIMTDRVFLIQSWPFLVDCIGHIIEYLQMEADVVFKSESNEDTQSNSRPRARWSNVVTPRNFHQQRGDNSNARPLVQLTGNQDLYTYIHTAFTWIMRACRKRLKEQVTHGKITDENLMRAEILARAKRSYSVMSMDDPNVAAASAELNSLSLVALKSPDEPTSPTRAIFTSLRQMREVLQPPLFKAIAWHLLLGNQVIWRGQDQALVSSALHILKDILPIGCVKMQINSDVYVNSYKANILGLNDKVAIPQHVQKQEFFILVDVVPKVSTTQKLNQYYPALFDMPQSPLSGIEFRMTSGCLIPEKVPAMLHKLEVALANDNLSNEVVKQCLICLKQEWMNKAKILYKFTKIDNRDKEDTSKLLQTVLNCSEEDFRLMKFWITGLSTQYKEELRRSALEA
ncbi:folliculin-like [Clavelina lepadiformis]|uniref:folliculin-like n=1 Tax=Clavelina lepadiformis TaxID=159417 RepID=UPI004042767A